MSSTTPNSIPNPVHRGSNPRRRRGSLTVIFAALAMLAAACGSGDLGRQAAAVSNNRPELVLEAALSPGEDPFTADASGLDEEAVDAARTVDHESIEVPDEIAGTDEAVGAIAALPGDSPGLYGGTGEELTCDPAAISAHLGSDLTKAEAWADAQGIGLHGIDPFLDTLTPMVLLHDTRVTNHGYRDGVANPFQAVLQAGTAVLVDPHGVPRVRCACGNPLAAPDTSVRHDPIGLAWHGYGTTPAVTVTVNQVVNVFIVINVYTSEPYEVPTGSDVSTAPPPEPPYSEPPQTTTTSIVGEVDQGPVPDFDATTCFSRYAELIVLLTPLGLDPLSAAEWMDEHTTALGEIDAGDFSGATDTICGLVVLMEAAYLELSGG